MIDTTIRPITAPLKATEVDASSESSINAFVASQEAHNEDVSLNLVSDMNAFADEANDLKDEMNQQGNDISANVVIMSGYVATTNDNRDKTLGYKNATQILHDDTVALLENVDITGTGGYTIAAVDDMFTRQRNSQFVGLT